MTNGHFTEDICTFMIIYRIILPRMKKYSDKFIEKFKTHTLCSRTYSKNHAIYEIMCEIW